MPSLVDVPFDVFSSILQRADIQSLLSISKCNKKFESWARSPALWGELTRQMQQHGVLLPPKGFTSIPFMSDRQLKNSALRAHRIRSAFTSPVARPTNHTIFGCSPSYSKYPCHSSTSNLEGYGYAQSSSLPSYNTTQRVRWVIGINSEWLAVKLGYHTSAGFLQFWKKGEVSPRAVMQYRHDWVMWGSSTDFGNQAWYFLISEDGPSSMTYGHKIRLLRFSGFSPSTNNKRNIVYETAATFPTYGSPITTFFLSITNRRLAILYSGSNPARRTVTLFFVPDWDEEEVTYVDTGIPDVYDKSSFTCSWDEDAKTLSLQYETDPKLRGRLLLYKLDAFLRYALPFAPLPPPAHHLNPPRIVPSESYEINFRSLSPFHLPLAEAYEDEGDWNGMQENAHSFHELRSAVFCDNDFHPANPHTAGRTDFPSSTSSVSFAANYGRDLHPEYIFEHFHASVPPAPAPVYSSETGLQVGEYDPEPPTIRLVQRITSYRLATPPITRIAYSQDYMDRNSAERFPIGHSLDLRGHELAAMGQGMAAWIEAKGREMNPRDATARSNVKVDDNKFELKVVVFPRTTKDEYGDEMVEDMVVCKVECPPFVNLATVSGIWLDAVQGQIFLGLKWGRFVALQFD